MMWAIRKQEKGVKTYIDKVIGYVWIVVGIAGLVVSASAIFLWSLPILFIVILMMGSGTAITGLIIKFKPIIFSGFAGILLSFVCLIVKGYASILLFALIFLVMMVIPGHILNVNKKHY
jgi:asparagine N-glycosylation enzyme membrane subunit Stt3